MAIFNFPLGFGSLKIMRKVLPIDLPGEPNEWFRKNVFEKAGIEQSDDPELPFLILNTGCNVR